MAGVVMHFDLDERGDWIVDFDELAGKFGSSSGYLQHQIKLGILKGFLEAGSGENAGRSRITVRAGGSAWQGIFDNTGFLVSETMLPDA
ncbi:hypothetical protein MOX02_53540 [Methylobacterium oxalidis]|uniref:Uncharacterized protein n=2 Tax=Methylobacterium oxalidis TaxID=944322 RepID=A0A512JBI7_9HYPH|nr:hypothetical protein MOX02_53540 [Methylobacterium oxalidis]GLS64100.1 hypothetical protein GCM10007888_24810 [Methylobacterium oxalidis]